MTRIWSILMQALKSLQNLHFNWSLLCKLYNFRSQKVQRSYLSWHWRIRQNLKKIWLAVSKITWGIWQIFIRTLESVRIGTFVRSFCPNEKMHKLKIYRGVMGMALKNDEKSVVELTCRFKIDIKNLTNLDSTTGKSRKFTL